MISKTNFNLNGWSSTFSISQMRHWHVDDGPIRLNSTQAYNIHNLFQQAHIKPRSTSGTRTRGTILRSSLHLPVPTFQTTPSLLKTPNYQSNQEMLHYISSSPLRPRFLLLPSPPSNLRFLTMSASPSSSSSRSVRGAAVSVPSLGADEACAVADEAFRRYTSPSLLRRGGVGVAVVWFRNDLRVIDNEALLRAWAASEAVLPVYCVDPRVFAGSTHYFGFPKKGGEDLAILHFARCCCFWDLSRSGVMLICCRRRANCKQA